MNDLISVIVPVYKAEKTIRICVESILAQTHKNLEILLIDDGSPDNCPAICDEYAALDSRVTVIHKHNGGVSSARNMGIKSAHGRYVCFADSDDYLPEDGIARRYQACLEDGSDFVYGNMEHRMRIDAYREPKALLNYLKRWFGCYYGLFDLQRIKANGVLFDESICHSEDTIFLRRYLKHCQYISVIPERIYVYDSTVEGSLSKQPSKELHRCFEKKLLSLRELTTALNLAEQEQEEYLSYRAIHGIHITILRYFRHYRKKEIRKRLLEETINVLKPWITRDPLEYLTDDVVLGKWYKKAQKAIAENDYSRLYVMLAAEVAKEKYINKAKRTIRELQKRCKKRTA